MITCSAWSGKKYAVLGLARSGRATVEALLASGAEVLAWDSKPEAREPFVGRVALADPVEADLTGYAGVVVSPGVPLNTHPIAAHAARYGVPVIGDIELFAQASRTPPKNWIVGITGTNGKSTTTALVHHILKTAGIPATMAGNIGLPILEQEPLPEGGAYILELSSYQIDLTQSLDCDVAVLLNVTPDHLDRYENFETYRASKYRLFEMQSDWQQAFDVTAGDLDEERLPDLRGAPSLKGSHNRENAKAAIAVARLLEIDEAKIIEAFETYSGLSHRMERVAEIASVAFVNDSKGTNTAATAPALAAFDNIHWIVGGLAKEAGLGECEAQLGHVKAAYTIGQAGEDFARLLEKRVPIKRSITLEQAVSDASNAAVPGDTVLLSPACASFDQFRDFEERGDRFRDLVAALREQAA